MILHRILIGFLQFINQAAIAIVELLLTVESL